MEGRGSTRLVVCVREEVGHVRVGLEHKLNDSFQLAKFVRNVLPGVLERMKVAHGWSTLPRVIVHDKASYMVNAASQHLNAIFAGALAESGMRSWVYAIGDDACLRRISSARTSTRPCHNSNCGCKLSKIT